MASVGGELVAGKLPSLNTDSSSQLAGGWGRLKQAPSSVVFDLNGVQEQRESHRPSSAGSAGQPGLRTEPMTVNA